VNPESTVIPVTCIGLVQDIFGTVLYILFWTSFNFCFIKFAVGEFIFRKNSLLSFASDGYLKLVTSDADMNNLH
jgi:hypothetical protein